MGGAVADKKLGALRTWMKAQKLDAYLVPHADRFQSEYLAPDAERLAWLTGFTGSAGLAVVFKDTAALFTDGRYTLQAKKQVDTTAFQIVEAPPASPMTWIKDKLSANARIGFDPWLVTVSQMKTWKRIGAENNWEFVALDENPIDVSWNDKPVIPVQQAAVHPLEFSGEATAQKIAKILQGKAEAAHHILHSEPALVTWLLNMRGNDVTHTPLVQSVALLDGEGNVTLFTDPRKITDDLRREWGNHVVVEELNALYGVLKKINKPVQIDPESCSYAVRHFCDENTIPVVEKTDPGLMLRACKNDTEIKGAFLAHEKDAAAYAAFLQWFKSCDFAAEKITELDIVAKLHDCRVQAGIVDESFDTIAGFGPNGAIVHYRADEASNLQLTPNNLLLLDSGGQYRCGTTDVTRVLAVGTPTAEMKTHYTAVLRGLIALSLTRFPVGTTGAQLDAIARAPIWALGLDYAHGTGHGVGSYLSVHEGPQGISVRGTTALAAGMVLSIEPGIYLTGKYGIRLENLVVVTEDKRDGDEKAMLGFKALTQFPFEAELIDWDALQPHEIAWLKDFKTARA